MTLIEVRFWIDGSATMVLLVKDPDDMEEIESRVDRALKERGFDDISHGIVDVDKAG